MTDKRGDDLKKRDELNEPTSGAGYGNDAEELRKDDSPEAGEEKSA